MGCSETFSDQFISSIPYAENGSWFEFFPGCYDSVVAFIFDVQEQGLSFHARYVIVFEDVYYVPALLRLQIDQLRILND
jgi:hypothetical protein